MRLTPKKIVVLIALAGLVGLGVFAWNANRGAAPGPGAPGGGKPGGPPGGFPIAVEVAAVTTRDFVDDANAVGSLKSRESVILRPEVAGRIAQIGFKEGSVVDRGAVLIRLDASLQDAELAQARANLALARANHQRSEELLARKFISQQSLDSSAATLKVQEAAVQLAEAKVAKTVIRAPFRGRVGLRNVSVGDYVKEAQELINLEDIEVLRVDFRLPEAYLGRLVPGQGVEVAVDALPGKAFRAELDAVDPAVDAAGRAISARARLDNRDGQLRPGMFVRVRLLFGARKGVLMVPEQAIVPGNTPSVFKVADDKAVKTPVRLGVRRDAEVEVVEGLAAGEVVVSAGQLKLRDGAAVRPIGEMSPVPAPKPADAKPAAAQ